MHSLAYQFGMAAALGMTKSAMDSITRMRMAAARGTPMFSRAEHAQAALVGEARSQGYRDPGAMVRGHMPAYTPALQQRLQQPATMAAINNLRPSVGVAYATRAAPGGGRQYAGPTYKAPAAAPARTVAARPAVPQARPTVAPAKPQFASISKSLRAPNMQLSPM